MPSRPAKLTAQLLSSYKFLFFYYQSINILARLSLQAAAISIYNIGTVIYPSFVRQPTIPTVIKLTVVRSVVLAHLVHRPVDCPSVRPSVPALPCFQTSLAVRQPCHRRRSFQLRAVFVVLVGLPGYFIYWLPSGCRHRAAAVRSSYLLLLPLASCLFFPYHYRPCPMPGQGQAQASRQAVDNRSSSASYPVQASICPACRRRKPLALLVIVFFGAAGLGFAAAQLLPSAALLSHQFAVSCYLCCCSSCFLFAVPFLLQLSRFCCYLFFVHFILYCTGAVRSRHQFIPVQAVQSYLFSNFFLLFYLSSRIFRFAVFLLYCCYRCLPSRYLCSSSTVIRPLSPLSGLFRLLICCPAVQAAAVAQ